MAAVLLLAGCGVQPSGVTDGGEAPTGVAPGVTLYFVDARGELRAQPRARGRLGSITEAMSLLLTGPGRSGLHTEITPNTTTQVVVTTTPDVINILVPLTIQDVTPLGIDQMACTALGVHVQGGGSKSTKVQLQFVQPTPESDKLRTCPLIK
ncbi:hypothetical protein JOF56_005325 [Kibdelosporangium banguiense]|uniref:GerMN domain-containing protein n=1 Tax=Kibdelosporangium banguiense TaxID=1365924 RepID=A0ABS4TKI7_9PSEU|nr:hypothetical protein [Kibdelosporangium banguiense]MBP2324940.1 hypothetical protein [Kibdelosporangium banguiense]